MPNSASINAAPGPSSVLLPDEDPNVLVDVARLFDEPDAWLQAPNAHLGGLSPSKAIARGHETAVRNLLRQIIYVGMS